MQGGTLNSCPHSSLPARSLCLRSAQSWAQCLQRHGSTLVSRIPQCNHKSSNAAPRAHSAMSQIPSVSLLLCTVAGNWPWQFTAPFCWLVASEATQLRTFRIQDEQQHPYLLPVPSARTVRPKAQEDGGDPQTILTWPGFSPEPASLRESL